MNKTLYLHVGANRCGSTSIRDFFQRIHILNLGYEYLADEYRLGADITSKYGKSERIRNVAKMRMLKKISTSPADKIIISSENFWTRLYAGDTTIKKRIVDFIKDTVDCIDTKILIVIRRQDKVAESTYLWRLKAVKNYRIPFQEYLQGITVGGYDFNSNVQLFEDAFGPENVRVIPFELLPADSDRFKAALLDYLGIRLNGPLDYTFPRYNMSLNAEGVDFLLNRTTDVRLDEEQKILREYVEMKFPNTSGERPVLFHEGQREAFLARFAEPNAALFARHGLDARLWE